MTSEAANGFIAEVVEFYLRAKNRSDTDDDEPIFLTAAEKLACQLSSETITLTTKFSETDIPDDSIALHPVHGTIFSDYDDWGWYFSSKQFVDDLMAAEANPSILSHFLHVNSGGGEAWYLDIAAAALQGVKKPVVAYAESVMASAAYYLAMYADRIYAGTKFDIIGSIGTMTSFIDLIPLLEKYGAKYIEEYADQSTRKNKKYNDLRKGEPEQFKKEVLNPLAAEFISAVKSARPQIKEGDGDRGVFQGETFFTQDAESLGLIDGVRTLAQAITEAHDLGLGNREQQKAKTKALHLISL